ncbi:MAG: curlin repeat-containing protein [Paludibacter sp.]
MKKLSFILAMVLGTGMAIAQVNTVNLTQSGGNQEAVIGQTGTNTANVTQSTDDGMKQRTNVSQSGSNTINITQTELLDRLEPSASNVIAYFIAFVFDSFNNSPH